MNANQTGFFTIKDGEKTGNSTEDNEANEADNLSLVVSFGVKNSMATKERKGHKDFLPQFAFIGVDSRLKITGN